MARKLNPAVTARFGQGGSCIDGTRTDVLNKIDDWSGVPTSTESFWVHGFAGSGKSTISVSICERLKAKNKLAGAFYCKRDVADQRDPKRILSSISYSLTNVCKPYYDLVHSALENESDISGTPVTYQLTTLFTGLLPMIREMPREPLVFVIDALDECGDDTSRPQIVDSLLQIAKLTSWLKVLITSRPQPKILHAFRSKNVRVDILDLNSIDPSNDIMVYTKSCLQDLADNHALDEKWLGDDTVQSLTRRASGLFIWTSIVFRFVQNQFDKDYAMELILGEQATSAGSSLDALFMTIIGSGPSEGLNLAMKKTVLGFIRITAENRPLSIDGLFDFMQASGIPRMITKATIRATIDQLSSVLYEDASKGGMIRVCHPSILDFLSQHNRCGQYWTNTDQLHQMMVERSMNLMKMKLKFNICDLETSNLANKDVEDMAERVNANIPDSLQYSCLYWTTHLTGSNRAGADELIASFLRSRDILYWLEVLSLLGGLKRALIALEAIADIYEVKFPARSRALCSRLHI